MATTPGEAPAELLFIDTNVWLYATDPVSPFHTRALTALDRAQDGGATLVTSPQILREYLAVGTRPGVIASRPSLVDLLANVAEIRLRCRLVEETVAVVDRLATVLGTIPTAYRRVHDAKYRGHHVDVGCARAPDAQRCRLRALPAVHHGRPAGLTFHGAPATPFSPVDRRLHYAG